MLSTAPRLIPEPARTQALILWFDEVSIADIPLVGGKNASLGEMIQQLTPNGVNVPNGFATTAAAYRYFIAQAGLESKLHQIFADLDVDNLQNLRQRGEQARWRSLPEVIVDAEYAVPARIRTSDRDCLFPALSKISQLYHRLRSPRPDSSRFS
jgi:Pyruvate phosphate dikinase, AMP/ATP-binding domain